MKRFETFLGNEFRVWVASDDVTINLKTNRVTIVSKTKDNEPARTVFNLNVLPVYTVIV